MPVTFNIHHAPATPATHTETFLKGIFPAVLSDNATINGFGILCTAGLTSATFAAHFPKGIDIRIGNAPGTPQGFVVNLSEALVKEYEKQATILDNALKPTASPFELSL